MYRMSLFTGLALVVLGVGFMTAQDKTAKAIPIARPTSRPSTS